MVIDRATLARTAADFAAGRGPVAVDAERASGFRYSQRAYLVQLRRAGAGTALVDPIPLGGDLSALAPALAGPEWVLHAANQDLPCLSEIGLAPGRLFDTELAGRLAGLPRVGLGPLVEQMLGVRLEKGHGAADWSRRPLPEDWLVYAALDVEVLVQLRDVLAELLDRAGQVGLGDGGVRSRPHGGSADAARRALAPDLRHPQDPQAAGAGHRARALDRPRPARGRAGHRARTGAAGLDDRRGGGRPARLRRGHGRDAGVPRALPAQAGQLLVRGRRPGDGAWNPTELPLSTPPAEGPPPVARWADRDPAAAARLTAARAGIAEVAKEWSIPVENLLQPDLLRRLCWSPPDDGDLAGALRKGAAREWQIEPAHPVLDRRPATDA